jgi:hypothetical protein
VPVKNEITADPTSRANIGFYAKRQKFYSAFSLFEYQRNELSYSREEGTVWTDRPKEMIRHVIRLLDRLDIWEDGEMWAIIAEMRRLLDRLKIQIDNAPFNRQVSVLLAVRRLERSLDTFKRIANPLEVSFKDHLRLPRICRLPLGIAKEAPRLDGVQEMSELRIASVMSNIRRGILRVF